MRREIEPVAREAIAGFLPAWQGIRSDLVAASNGASGHTSPGPARVQRLLEVVAQLQGLSLPVSVLERDILPLRVRGYTPAMLDQALATGEVVWVGRGALGPSDGRIVLLLSDELAALLPTAEEEPPHSELHDRLRAHLESRGASFFRDLFQTAFAVGRLGEGEVLGAIWDMVWAGEVTNDSFAPLRLLGPRRAGPQRRTLLRLGPPAAGGRWSLVAHLRDREVSPTERLHACAGLLLKRHGVLTRAAALAEGVPGGFAAIYPVLRAMEEAGRVKRGYFVEGLGGAQFALAGAVDRLRSEREGRDVALALSAVDPANAYGVTVPWPRSPAGARMGRVPGAYVILEGGRLGLYLERGGRSLLTAGEVTPAQLLALASVARRGLRKLEIERVDGEPVGGSSLEQMLRQAGFVASPRGLVLWPERVPVPA